MPTKAQKISKVIAHANDMNREAERNEQAIDWHENSSSHGLHANTCKLTLNAPEWLAVKSVIIGATARLRAEAAAEMDRVKLDGPDATFGEADA